MPSEETQTNQKTVPEIVKQPEFPKYDYQKLEYGSGSAGGVQNNHAAASPKETVNRTGEK